MTKNTKQFRDVRLHFQMSSCMKEAGMDASEHQERLNKAEEIDMDLSSQDANKSMPKKHYTTVPCTVTMPPTHETDHKTRTKEIDQEKITAPPQHTTTKYERETQIRDLFWGSSSSQGQTATTRVQKHRQNLNLDLRNKAYLTIIRDKTTSSDSRDDDYEFNHHHQHNELPLELPLGRTLLHIAASCGNDEWVSEALHNSPKLITARNSNGDMPLHVAARVGRISTLKKLLYHHQHRHRYTATTKLSSPSRPPHPHSVLDTLEEILTGNNQGNTFVHEALLNGHTNVVMSFLLSYEEEEEEEEKLFSVGDCNYQEMVSLAVLFQINKQKESILYLAVMGGYKEVVKRALNILVRPKLGFIGNLNLVNKDQSEQVRKLIPRGPDVLRGESPLLAAIMKQNQEILELILTEIPEWIHLRDEEGRTPLHYASSLGYLYGVQYLLSKCASCAIERDNHGFFPLHYASNGGHIQVLEELMKKQYCLDPREMLDNGGRNLLHIAIESGNLGIVNYILKCSDNEIGEMINVQDANGNTPLHLATFWCHPKIVHALTWDKRVKLNLVNENNQTVLDVCMQKSLTNQSLCQRLTCAALISAGVPYGVSQACPIIKAPSKREVNNLWDQEAPKKMDNQHLTMSIPAFGVTLVILSLAFLIGIISNDLNLLAITALVLSVSFILMLLSLYLLLWLPFTSSSPILRYLSYYPFLMFASLVEAEQQGLFITGERKIKEEPKKEEKKKEDVSTQTSKWPTGQMKDKAQNDQQKEKAI